MRATKHTLVEKKICAQGAVEYLLIIAAAILVTGIVVLALASVSSAGKSNASVGSLDSVYKGLQDIADAGRGLVKLKIALFAHQTNEITFPTLSSSSLEDLFLGVDPLTIIVPWCTPSEYSKEGGVWAPSAPATNNCFLKSGELLTIIPTVDVNVEILVPRDQNDSRVVYFAGGQGTTTNPYQIKTCQQFEQINYALDKYFVFANTIDCGGADTIVPIGSLATPFTGHLDGKGYTLINFSLGVTNAPYAGVFTAIAAPAGIENITLSNVIARNTTTINNREDLYTGALVGLANNDTLLSNIFVVGGVGAYVPIMDGTGNSYSGILVGKVRGNVALFNLATECGLGGNEGRPQVMCSPCPVQNVSCTKYVIGKCENSTPLCTEYSLEYA